MLKITKATLERMESSYPGIREQIFRFDGAELPVCPHCNSPDTASVQVGLIGRTINLCAATSKFHLIPNGPKPGEFFCNSCRKYFNDITTKPA